MSVLNEEEKVQIRHHCGYLNVQEAATFVLGTPAGVETQFIIEGAMNRVLERALPQIRRHIGILDTIEEQMVGNLELLQITRIDTIEVNSTGPHREQRQLRENYDYWVNSLCNLLGVQRNPFDKRLEGFQRGVNVRVAH